MKKKMPERSPRNMVNLKESGIPKEGQNISRKRARRHSYCGLLGEISDWILTHGNEILFMFTLIRIVQTLDPKHYRDVMESIIETIGTSNDDEAIRRLTSNIAKTADYLLDQERKARDGAQPGDQLLSRSGEAVSPS